MSAHGHRALLLERPADGLGGGFREIVGRMDPERPVGADRRRRRVLARDNWARLVAGESADARLPGAIADADRAYGLLRGGLGAVYG
jgi:hypothetical protein